MNYTRLNSGNFIAVLKSFKSKYSGFDQIRSGKARFEIEFMTINRLGSSVRLTLSDDWILPEYQIFTVVHDFRCIDTNSDDLSVNHKRRFYKFHPRTGGPRPPVANTDIFRSQSPIKLKSMPTDIVKCWFWSEMNHYSLTLLCCKSIRTDWILIKPM